MIRRWPLALLALVVAVLGAGCGIASDSAPRDITGDRQGQLGEIGRDDTDIPAGGGLVYFVDGGTQIATLRSVARDVSLEPEALLRSLLQGPSTTERTDRLRTAIPADTELIGWRRDGPGLVTVNLSEGILEASGDSLVDAVAQIVYTLDEIDNVDRVQLQVEGEARQWPSGDGTLTGEPLTVYQYPGRAASIQPDYPALPSATPAPTT